MTPLSTLTSSDLHALVAQSLEGVTEGPWMHLAGDRLVWTRLEDGCRGLPIAAVEVNFGNKRAANLSFIAQSRDLVPELDRRLRETEAKLEIAVRAMQDECTCDPDYTCRLCRDRKLITNLA